MDSETPGPMIPTTSAAITAMRAPRGARHKSLPAPRTMQVHIVQVLAVVLQLTRKGALSGPLQNALLQIDGYVLPAYLRRRTNPSPPAMIARPIPVAAVRAAVAPVTGIPIVISTGGETPVMSRPLIAKPATS